MADKKITKKVKKESVAEKKEKKNESKKVSTNSSSESRSLKELKMEMQKLSLDVRTGKEKNTSLIRKLRRDIARQVTKLNVKS